MKIIIHGTATAVSPLHIAAPGDARADINGHIVFGSRGFPCTRVQHMPVLLSDNGETRMEPLPIIPSNSWRGRLRRDAAAVIQETLVARGERVSLAAYNTLRCGAPHGYPSSPHPTLEDVRAARAHLFFGLFGGAPKLYRSHVITDTSFPLMAHAIDAGVVSAAYQDRAIGQIPRADGSSFTPRITSAVFFKRTDDSLMFTDPTAEKVIADYAESVEGWRELTGVTETDDTESVDVDPEDEAAVAAAAAAAAEKLAGPKKPMFRGVRGFVALELVHPGTPFAFRVEAEGSPAQIGLTLEAVRRLQNRQIGGWVRNGFGRMTFDLIADIDDETVVPYRQLEGSEVELNRDIEQIATLDEAMHDALDELTVAEIEAIAKGDEKTEEKREAALATLAKNA